MRNTLSKNDKRLIPAVAAALLIGMGLHDLFSLWPSIVTEFIAPVNESIWEHVKIVFWPLLLVELVFHPREQRAAGLTSLFLVCTWMLGTSWLYHVALGGRAFLVDIVLFAGSILLWFWLSSVLPVPRSWLPVLNGLLVLLIGLIFAFTITPPHGTLFNDPTLADAWSVLPC
ncbi:MAG: DUF6512 family protein [Oscillospiraceae bacterium]|nr:DUF6512 family protein [Oscillospiraceae bacterium]